MIFSQYKKNCEVILNQPKIGGEDIKDYVGKAIRNILDENIYVHRRRLIAEFPGYGMKFISKLQSNCANMNFLTKVDVLEFYRKLHIKEGNK